MESRYNYVVIEGNIGAGKTTLLRLLIREETPTSGSIFFKEIDDTVESVETPGDAIFVQAGFSKLFSSMESIFFVPILHGGHFPQDSS